MEEKMPFWHRVCLMVLHNMLFQILLGSKPRTLLVKGGPERRVWWIDN